MTNEQATKALQAQADGDLTTALCSLPKIQSEDGQDYVQLADVLETVRRFKPQNNYDLIQRQAVMDCFKKWQPYMATRLWDFEQELSKIPSVKPQEKTGHCKDCKYFEYDVVANLDGIPLIVAHEFCNKWGDGCKTREDGYCFLFEPQERSE